MPQSVRRGFAPEDHREFFTQREKLLQAAEEVAFLLDRGYPVTTACQFVGNHHLLSERQRLALARGLSSIDAIRDRQRRQLARLEPGAQVWIDTFNTVISLEVALSGSTLLLGRDGVVRDLAGLRGTYRLIDKTECAVQYIRELLEAQQVQCAYFLLDAPVSNSGRLRARLMDCFADSPVQAECTLLAGVDRLLYEKACVISGDAIILDHCLSWYNLVRTVIDSRLGPYPYVDFSGVRI